MHEVEDSYRIAEAIFCMLQLHQHLVQLLSSPFRRLADGNIYHSSP